MSIEQTLAERAKTHGHFESHAFIAQNIKIQIQRSHGYSSLDYTQREALDMIAHKMSRLVNGDCYHRDSWHDIMGYAKLIDMRLEAME